MGTIVIPNNTNRTHRVVAILKKYDVVLSLGNGIRAGAIHDSSDRAQVAELVINCELAEIGRELGCQMMVEGPGHVPLDEIEGNIQLEKRMSGNAPYYVLGPLPCDVGAGYDHVTAAVGAASSSRFGAELICYITPAEHLALPNVDDVRRFLRRQERGRALLRPGLGGEKVGSPRSRAARRRTPSPAGGCRQGR